MQLWNAWNSDVQSGYSLSTTTIAIDECTNWMVHGVGYAAANATFTGIQVHQTQTICLLLWIIFCEARFHCIFRILWIYIYVWGSDSFRYYGGIYTLYATNTPEHIDTSLCRLQWRAILYCDRHNKIVSQGRRRRGSAAVLSMYLVFSSQGLT